MIDTNMYKRITIFLSIAVIFLLISNYSALRKLDLVEEKKDSSSIIIEEIDSSLIEIEPLKESIGTIVLIIDDFGYRNDLISDGFLELEVPITCAIIPGHSQSQKFAKKALNAGKEVIIHMPMESSVATSGEEEYKIKIGMTSEEIEWRINEVFNEIPEAVGMNNHQGSRATADSKIMSVVASVLKNRDKYFLKSINRKLSILNKAINKNNNFIVKDYFSIADIAIWSFMCWLTGGNIASVPKDIAKNYNNILRLCRKIDNKDIVQKWVNKTFPKKYSRNFY